MTNELKTLTAKACETPRYGIVYRVAYDGRFYGDDRAFTTEAECAREIDNRIATDARDAVRYDRPVMYRKG